MGIKLSKSIFLLSGILLLSLAISASDSNESSCCIDEPFACWSISKDECMKIGGLDSNKNCENIGRCQFGCCVTAGNCRMALRMGCEDGYDFYSELDFDTCKSLYCLEQEQTGIKDGDNDGVVDDKDLCPYTPLFTIVDYRGCKSDGYDYKIGRVTEQENEIKDTKVIEGDHLRSEDAIKKERESSIQVPDDRETSAGSKETPSTRKRVEPEEKVQKEGWEFDNESDKWEFQEQITEKKEKYVRTENVENLPVCHDGIIQGECSRDLKYCGNDNLIINSGFEIIENNFPKHWYKVGEGAVESSQDSFVGLYSVVVRPEGSRTSGVGIKVDVEPNTEYKLTSYVNVIKYDQGGKIRLSYSCCRDEFNCDINYCQELAHLGKYIDAKANEWTELYVYFKTPGDVNRMNVYQILATTAGESVTLVDSVTLEKYSENPDFTDNCGFCGCQVGLFCYLDNKCLEICSDGTKPFNCNNNGLYCGYNQKNLILNGEFSDW